MQNNYRGVYNSPVGPIEITSAGDTIIKAVFVPSSGNLPLSQDSEIISQAITELDEYFMGKRKEFNIRIHQPGSGFEQEIRASLMGIPYGNTISYSGLAWLADHPRAIRAAANAIAKNDIAIFLPCHRVTGKNTPGGYKWGMEKKEWLLNHEKRFADK